MPTGFDQAFRRVKQLVADFKANEKFYSSPQNQEQEVVVSSLWLEFIGAQRRRYTNRCDGGDCQIDALVYDLYALTPAEIKIVEEA